MLSFGLDIIVDVDEDVDAIKRCNKRKRKAGSNTTCHRQQQHQSY
jgi:hypothetical protein